MVIKSAVHPGEGKPLRTAGSGGQDLDLLRCLHIIHVHGRMQEGVLLVSPYRNQRKKKKHGKRGKTLSGNVKAFAAG